MCDPVWNEDAALGLCRRTRRGAAGGAECIHPAMLYNPCARPRCADRMAWLGTVLLDVFREPGKGDLVVAHASLRSRRFVDLLGRARRRQPSYRSFKDPTDANPRVRILGAAAAEPGDPIRAGDAPRVLSITGSVTARARVITSPSPRHRRAARRLSGSPRPRSPVSGGCASR
jgi:hypothetical protein